MSKTLYVSDLDGTLLSEGSLLTEESARILNTAISKGALFSIATARTPATVSFLLREVDMTLPLIVMTGAAMWDKRTGLYSDVNYITAQATSSVIDAYRTCGASAFLYTLPLESSKDDQTDGRRGKMLIYHIGAMSAIERNFMLERIDSPFKRFDVPESGVSHIPSPVNDAILFFGMQPNAVAFEVLDKLNDIPDINPMFYHDWMGEEIAEIEAFGKNSTKALAVRRLAGRIGADRIVVFGDNNNDISMMKIADLSVAVDNAVDAVKEAADIVIGPNTSDSVARFILRDFENH